MADTTSRELTMAERFVLLNSLPQGGDNVTFKILRKLRESLAPSEKELQDYSFKYTYRCPHKEYDEKGKAFRCEYEELSSDVPKCPIHDTPMLPEGRVSWDEKMWDKTKQIYFGHKAHNMIVESLTKVSEEEKKINDDVVAGLYEKFVESKGEEE